MRTHIPTGYGLMEVVFGLTGMARLMSTTLGLSFNNVPTQTTSNNLHTFFIQVWQPRLPTAYRFKGGRLYVGDGTATPPFFASPVDIAGTNINTLLYPPSVVHVVQKVTAQAGRKARGRMFIPGAKEGDATNLGVIPAATLATYNTSLAALKVALEGHADVGGLYLLGHEAANPPLLITALTMRPKLGSQVRRLRHV